MARQERHTTAESRQQETAQTVHSEMGEMSVTGVPSEQMDEPMVRYAGPATVREITREQWAQAGVSDQDTASWIRDGSLPKGLFSESALNVLSQDGSFVIDKG